MSPRANPLIHNLIGVYTEIQLERRFFAAPGHRRKFFTHGETTPRLFLTVTDGYGPEPRTQGIDIAQRVEMRRSGAG
jgi:hypothetical protein